MTARHTLIRSGLGELTLVAAGATLTGVYYLRHWHLPSPDTFGPAVDVATDPVLAAATHQLEEYLAGRRTSFDLPTGTSGNAFHEQVWALLKEIPYAATTTYGELAARLGDRSQARRVGQAVGRNPLSVIVPCHRVLGANGSLTGYAGGLDRKRLLLDLESVA
ncbi:MAG: methylated-DNA--[protein]-cysteine S-methyltransferase [Mycobacteriales bacterium]